MLVVSQLSSLWGLRQVQTQREATSIEVVASLLYTDTPLALQRVDRPEITITQNTLPDRTSSSTVISRDLHSTHNQTNRQTHSTPQSISIYQYWKVKAEF